MPHILFLMSDTGGGHRSACRAIEAALNARFPGQFTSELVDLWKDYTPFPFNRMPTLYSRWVNRSPATYSAQFWVNDRIFRLHAVSTLYNRTMYTRMRRLYKQHPADLIVCAHSVFVRPAVHALRRDGLHMPFITVITDYALPTVLWYDAGADRTLIPTEPALQRGLRLGLPREKMILTGAPIHPKFTDLKLTKAEARAELGWPADARIVLLIGGGDGMGPLVKMAKAIDRLNPPSELVIIAGRNEAMRAQLQAMRWQRPTRIYGFVTNMQVFMRAADLLITKAGPATITEAAALGLPMIISGAIRYQETPNTEYVVAKGAGVFAPGPENVAQAVCQLVRDDGTALHTLAEGARRIAQPDAVWNIAEVIRSYA